MPWAHHKWLGIKTVKKVKNFWPNGLSVGDKMAKAVKTKKCCRNAFTLILTNVTEYLNKILIKAIIHNCLNRTQEKLTQITRWDYMVPLHKGNRGKDIILVKSRQIALKGLFFLKEHIKQKPWFWVNHLKSWSLLLCVCPSVCVPHGMLTR